MTARMGHRFAACVLVLIAAACRRDVARARASAATSKDTHVPIVSMTDTGAIAAAVEGIIPARSARDTDSTGTGIVDGDLRPGTAASDPDSAATASARTEDAPATIPSPTGIPLVKGLRLTSALHFPD